MATKLYRKLAQLVSAYQDCIKTGSSEWEDKHGAELSRLAAYLPSGSGFDSGSGIDRQLSTPNKLHLYTAYHHMVEGMYDGWTEHGVIVTPSLVNGFDIRVTGRNRNDIKDYIADCFADILDTDIENL